MNVGKNVILYANSWYNIITELNGKKYSATISIGDGSVLTSYIQVSIAKKLVIGTNCAIGQCTTIVDHLHSYEHNDEPIVYSPITDPKPIIIEDDSFVGTNCVLSPGVHIGRHVFVGAGSVVTGRIPDFTMIAGNPAKVIRRYNEKTKVWERV